MSDDEHQPLVQSGNQEDSQGCFAPNKRPFRFTGLFFICFITFGPYFCYVLPGALEKEIERDMRISTTEFVLFTSLYSWPNVLICFFGGYLIDKILGVRLGGIIFSSLITGGIFIFAFGAYIDEVIIMDIGRFIFGMGGESVAIAQKAYAVAWFSKEELNLVFGLLVVGALSGASINQIIMVPIYSFVEQFESGYRCLGLAIFLAGTTCAFSTICTIIASYMDTMRTRFLKLKSNNVGTNQEAEKINLKDALKFPLELWLIFIICVVFYSATFPFISLGKLFFTRKYGFSKTISGVQQSLFFLITTVLSPVFGLIVDKTGYNTLWVIASCAMALAAHTMMMLTFINSFIPVILLATSLAICATALWPMVSELVPKHQLGTAYGLMQSIQNLGLASFTYLTGQIVENYGYMILELFFLSIIIIGLIASLILYFVDKTKNGPLGKTAKSRLEATIN